MPLAMAPWDARAGRRIAAAAIAAALQGAFCWLILREIVAPTAPLTSTPLEVTILQTARRLQPATLPPTRRPGVSPRQSAPVSQVPPPAETPQPITPPHAPIDWQQAMQGEVRAEESRPHAGQLHFGFPQAPAPDHAATAEFGWDYAHTHRVEQLSEGGMLINITDRCMVVLYVLPIPLCKIGAMPANGQLFDHIHDRRKDQPGALP